LSTLSFGFECPFEGGLQDVEVGVVAVFGVAVVGLFKANQLELAVEILLHAILL
jgi:hypothetical protein